MHAHSVLPEPDALSRLEGLRDLPNMIPPSFAQETVSAPMPKPQQQIKPAKAAPLMLSGALKRFVLDS